MEELKRFCAESSLIQSESFDVIHYTVIMRAYWSWVSVVFPSSFYQGILGSLKSGKSALVNKYITGSYAALEKSEGKKHRGV